MAAIIKAVLEGDSAGFRKEMNQAMRTVNDFKASASSIAPALAGALTIGGLIEFTKRNIEAGAHIQDLAERLGVTAQTVQHFDYAAKQVGSDMETLTRGILKAQSALATGSNTSRTYDVALQLVGLHMKDMLNLSPEEFLLKFADAFATCTNRGNANAAAVALFGGRVQSILPLLAKGREGIQKLFADAPMQSDAEIAELKRFEDELTRMGSSFEVVFRRIAAGIVEKFTLVGAAIRAGYNQLTGDTVTAEAQMEAVRKLQGKFDLAAPDVTVFQEALAQVRSAIENIHKANKNVTITADTEIAQAQLKYLYEKLVESSQDLSDLATHAQDGLGLNTDTDRKEMDRLKKSITDLQTDIAELEKKGITLPVNEKGISPLKQRLYDAEAELKKRLDLMNAPEKKATAFGTTDVDIYSEQTRKNQANELARLEKEIADTKEKAASYSETSEQRRAELVHKIMADEKEAARLKEVAAKTAAVSPERVAAAKAELQAEKDRAALAQLDAENKRKEQTTAERVQRLTADAAGIRDKMYLDSLTKAQRLVELQRRHNALIREEAELRRKGDLEGAEKKDMQAAKMESEIAALNKPERMSTHTRYYSAPIQLVGATTKAVFAQGGDPAAAQIRETNRQLHEANQHQQQIARNTARTAEALTNE